MVAICKNSEKLLEPVKFTPEQLSSLDDDETFCLTILKREDNGSGSLDLALSFQNLALIIAFQAFVTFKNVLSRATNPIERRFLFTVSLQNFNPRTVS